MFYQHRRLRVKDTLLDTKMTMTHADKLSSLEVIMASMPVTLDRRIEGYKKRSKKSPSCTRDTKFMKALSDGTTQGVTVTAEHVRRATSIYGPTLESIKVRITWTKGIPMPVTDYHRVTDSQTMKIDSPTVPHSKCAASRPHYVIFTARKICNSYKKSFSTTHRALWSTWNPNFSKESHPLASILGVPRSYLRSQDPVCTHTPQVKRSIRAVMQGTRRFLRTLPYNCLFIPFAHLPEFVAWRMSIFKSSTRPSDITAFHGRPFNAKIDGHLEFGS